METFVPIDNVVYDLNQRYPYLGTNKICNHIIMEKDYILDLMRSNKTVLTFKDVVLLWGESDVNFVKKRSIAMLRQVN